MVFSILLWAGIIIGSGLGVLWGIGSLLLGFDRYEEERAIRTTPIASLDSVAVGPTAIEGEIQPVDREIGSLYGCKRCVAYDLSVSDTGSDTSETHIERSYTVPFDIVTDGGSVRVRETTFDFQVSDGRQWDRERKSHQSADESRTDSTDEDKPLVLTDRDELCFISDKSPAELLRERRFALAKSGVVGIVVSVVSLIVFLWVTGIAQIFLGA